MKTIEITEPGKVITSERDIPDFGTDEVLLKIKYVGFCGSDLSTYLGRNTMVEFPRIPGHEISAIIEKKGVDVPGYFEVGQQVTVVPYTNCGQCTSCKQKRYNACKYNQTLGVQRDGAMSEYIAVPWQKILPDNELSDKELALVEPMTVGFHAVDNARVTDLDTVMVFGCGMIGCGAIARAKLRGATVIVVDIDDKKLETAKIIGADFVVNSAKLDLHKTLDEITNGDGPSVVIEASGSPIAYKSAIEEVAFSGRVVCIGYAKSDVAFQTKLWVQKELEIRGSRNANPSDFEAVMKYLKHSAFDYNILISKIVRPEEAAAAMRQWAEKPGETLKILVQFD
jgi:threonine dehydrogenase-like Zn-dependent dehydrogenase